MRRRPRILNRLDPAPETCLETEDHAEALCSMIRFFRLREARDPASQAARLADSFLRLNRANLRLLETTAEAEYDGSDVQLRLRTGSAVGAVPLFSPLTARPELGLVVQPRFPWKGIGAMLGEMGWTIVPKPLPLPLLRRSERRVPPWVISAMVLERLRALIERLDKRFEMVTAERQAPRGSVNWPAYAQRSMPRGRFLSLDCRYPDLVGDRELKGGIRFTLERQIQSLESQRGAGGFVHRLIDDALSLRRRVLDAAARRPGARDLDAWLHRPFQRGVFVEGVQAMEWTAEERGLAGISDLGGIPWCMSMEQFFEAWVETIVQRTTIHTGGRLRTGRRHETVSPVAWERPLPGVQKALIPDLVVEHEKCTFLFDAKYKRHWEEMQSSDGAKLSDELRERHREDFLQVLAYANLARTPDVVCCLVYPCRLEHWRWMVSQKRLIACAELPSRWRRVEVWLAAMPMEAATEEVAAPFTQALLARLRAA